MPTQRAPPSAAAWSPSTPRAGTSARSPRTWTRTSTLFDQYKYKLIRKTVKRKGKKRKITIRRKLKKKARPDLSNLSLQISFSNTPDPNSSMAITKTSAKTAAACTRSALKRGGGAFFYFASSDSMRLLFNQPEIASLRPIAAAAKKKKK